MFISEEQVLAYLVRTKSKVLYLLAHNPVIREVSRGREGGSVQSPTSDRTKFPFKNPRQGRNISGSCSFGNWGVVGHESLFPQFKKGKVGHASKGNKQGKIFCFQVAQNQSRKPGILGTRVSLFATSLGLSFWRRGGRGSSCLTSVARTLKLAVVVWKKEEEEEERVKSMWEMVWGIRE